MYFLMKKLSFIFLFGLLFTFGACEFEQQVDPNNPSLNSVSQNATRTQLNLLVTGAEASMRSHLGTYVTASGTIARELYLFDADPRNTEDLLGKGDAVLDNNTFYLTGTYNPAYRTIKTCNTLLAAVDNTNSISEEEKNGYRGFANTVKGYMYGVILDYLGQGGIRFDVTNPEALGPFISEAEGYNAVLGLLDEGSKQLAAASFAFISSPGFADFNTPETFNQFNQAIAARIATNAGRYGDALSLLEGSFLNLSGELSEGPKHVFSTDGLDILNPVFRPGGQNGDQIIINPDMIEDLRENDARINKFALRDNPTSQDGLNGDYRLAIYTSAISPIDIIRNEELILIYAEANMQTDRPDDAITAINVIRNAYGLGDYTGDMTLSALTDELLYQRRYSLVGEGRRMFDLRRYGRLNAEFLPIDREGDDIFQQFPIPLSENQ